MKLRELLFALVMVVGGVAIVHGVGLINRPAAWILGGVFVIALAWLFLGEVP
ncbi:MAG: hypothetical protein ACRDH9_09310 [Actinomycetota bacterium]